MKMFFLSSLFYLLAYMPATAQPVVFKQPYLRVAEGVYLPVKNGVFTIADTGFKVFSDVQGEHFIYRRITSRFRSSDSIYLGEIPFPGIFRIGAAPVYPSKKSPPKSIFLIGHYPGPRLTSPKDFFSVIDYDTFNNRKLHFPDISPRYFNIDSPAVYNQVPDSDTAKALIGRLIATTHPLDDFFQHQLDTLFTLFSASSFRDNTNKMLDILADSKSKACKCRTDTINGHPDSINLIILLHQKDTMFNKADSSIMMIFADNDLHTGRYDILARAAFEDIIIKTLLVNDTARYIAGIDSSLTAPNHSKLYLPIPIYASQRFTSLFDYIFDHHLYQIFSLQGLEPDNIFNLVSGYTQADINKLCNKFYVGFKQQYFNQVLFFIKLKK